MLDVRPLFSVVPMVALALGRLGARFVRAEHRMLLETAEAIVWGPEPHHGRCARRNEWHVTSVPPCCGCGHHD
ncbi:MAG: hypothetical protein ACREFU_08355 [Acetobacteraceae bacterium]